MFKRLARLWRRQWSARWYGSAVLAVIVPSLTVATAVFTLTDGVLFRPLSYPSADRLFAVQPGVRGAPPAVPSSSVSDFDVTSWTTAAPDVGFTAFSARQWAGFGSGVNDYIVGVADVQPNFFDVIGIPPMIGGFDPADFRQPARIRPVIMTHPVWIHRFGRASDVIGKTTITDASRQAGYRIVGVMPPGFVFPSDRADVAFIAPLVRQPNATGSRERSLYEVIARTPEGMNAAALATRVEQAMNVAAVSASAAPGASGSPANRPFDRAVAVPLSQNLGRQFRPLFEALFVAVLVLLGCSTINVSALAAARVLARRRELQIRRAIGASASSLGRMAFVELLPLVLVAGIISLALTAPLVRFAGSLLPDDLVLLGPVNVVSWRTLAFVAASVITVAAIAAIWPTLRTLSLPVGAAPGSRATESSRSWGSFVVVASQVAGGFVLLIGGLLTVASLLAVYSNTLPIRTDNVLLIEAFVNGPGGRMLEKSPERTARVDAIVERLRRVRGVSAVAVTSAQVLRGGGWPAQLWPDARPRRTTVPIDLHAVTPDYFRVLEPQIVEGRLPGAEELSRNARVVVVSERLAREFWPNASAVGQSLYEPGDAAPYTVAGVVKDVRWFSWDSEEVGSVYGPYALLSNVPLLTILMKVTGEQVGADAVSALAEVDPLVAPVRAEKLDRLFVDSVRPRRFRSWLFGTFAATAMVIIAVGVAALIAMATARRTTEIGVRRALGATATGIVRKLLSEQMRPVLTGVVIGGLVAAWASTLLSTYLYGLGPHDVRIWLGAAAMIVGCAGLGALVPTARASRLDPGRVLRAD